MLKVVCLPLVVDTLCDKPPLGQNGIWQLTKTKYRVFDYFTCKCKVGYKRSTGNMIRMCQRNGTWTGKEITCKSKFVGKG